MSLGKSCLSDFNISPKILLENQCSRVSYQVSFLNRGTFAQGSYSDVTEKYLAYYKTGKENQNMSLMGLR